MDRRMFILGAAGAALAGQAVAAPKAELWDRWTAHDPASALSVDHTGWDKLLQGHVRMSPSGVALVDYAGLKGQRAALDTYLGALQGTRVAALARSEQMALWINLYNALTVAVVLDHWPVESIRDIDISPGLFANGPWGAKLVTVEGEALSLDDIEHRILRPIWRDPRIHYAVNCASIGCPNLAPQAYTAARLEGMLEAGARAYVNHPRGISVQGGDVTASKIYDWFEEDFGGTEAGVLAHARKYAEPALKTALGGANGIDDFVYDWSLNAA